jgi:hypothetical protein
MKGLMEAGLSDWDAIQGGLVTCRASGNAFLPPVGEFTASCRRAVYERLGALDTMAAYKHLIGYYALPRESREPCRLNPAVYHTMSDSSFDVFAFKDMNSDKAVDYFSKHYRETMLFLASGGDMRTPVDTSMRIDNPSGDNYKGRSSMGTARQHLEAMRKKLKS